MALKPWYDVIKPRKDLRQGSVPEASEFAVHLDQVRDGRALEEYKNPELFFTRTYLTKNLIRFAAETIRRLSGEKVETNAIFHMITQFGGGKTHALTLLYHLAEHGPAAHTWQGVANILREARVAAIPKARTAVFVGTEFDPLQGRGGDDGTPKRLTPWGEIAFRLGREAAFAEVAEHDRQRVAPGGDVIRRFLPADQPCLILMDEVLNYIARTRKVEERALGRDMIDQFYHFLQSFTEQIRAMDRVVLAISIPSMEIEMGEEDRKAFERYSKMLERVGRPILISAEHETAEIIRRRLFDWKPEQFSEADTVLLPPEAHDTCRVYAEWAAANRVQLPGWFPFDHAQQAFLNTYPFHPTVLSVFERKWQALPRFQRTRGILRLLALWIAREYQQDYREAHPDPIIGLGTAPLDDRDFRAAIRSQLGDDERLEAPIMTDICGRDAFAVRLDEDASGEISDARLHSKAAITIFFESNGGMAGEHRKEATEPEVRLAVGEPHLNIGNIETVLEALTDRCYYLTYENKRYRFSLIPNLNNAFKSENLPYEVLDPILQLSDNYDRKHNEKIYEQLQPKEITFRTAYHYAEEADAAYLQELLRKYAGNNGNGRAALPHPVERVHASESPPHLTDVGNAQRLIVLYGDVLRYCSEHDRWFYWDGKVWRQDNAKHVAILRHAIDVPKALYREASQCEDADQRKVLAKFGKDTESKKRLTDLMYLAKSFRAVQIQQKQFDEHPMLYNCQNGIIDLHTGKPLFHNKDCYLSRLSPLSYHPNAPCPQWIQFLEDVMNNDKDMINFLQRAIGYTLTGDNSEECLFFLYGVGKNGKSTFINLLTHLLNGYRQHLKIESLILKRYDSIPNDLATLPGARLLTVSEIPEGKRLNESLVKDLTGGDEMSARFLHGEFFSFYPKFKLWMFGNHKPIITGQDEGIWRRIRQIPFEVIIPEKKRKPRRQCVFSNSTWKDGHLHPVYRQPFELLAVTNREYQQQKAASPSKSDLRSVWLPGPDSNQRPIG